MKQILTIAKLTWKSAFRYRLFWVLSALLLAAVVALPLLLKDDGTARGMTQILMTYTLSAITGLLGFATLWLSCGTMARDVEDCQMQVVSVKPIARWQIWLGKWIGIVGLNFALLVISGGCVFGLLYVRAGQLNANERKVLQEEVFVARASARPEIPDIERASERLFQEVVKKNNNSLNSAQLDTLRMQVRQRVRAENEVVPSGMMRRWMIDLGAEKDSLKGKPMRVRIKFQSAIPNYSEGVLYVSMWEVGPPDSPIAKRLKPQQFPADSFQEFSIPADVLDQDGKLYLTFANGNEMALLFGLEDGVEVLYPEGGFSLNYARGLGIILCWLAMLSAIGLAASSWLSFPVAAFFSIAVLVIGMSSSTLSGAIEQGSVFGLDHETAKPTNPTLDNLALPMFKGILYVIKVVEDFSPIDALSSGRSITWGMLALAFCRIVVLMGGLFVLAGIALFTRRELAAVQSTS
jgi:hypothetical protein